MQYAPKNSSMEGVCICVSLGVYIQKNTSQLISIHQKQWLLWYMWLLSVCETTSCSFPKKPPLRTGRPAGHRTRQQKETDRTCWQKSYLKSPLGSASHVAANHALGHSHAVQIHKHTVYIHRTWLLILWTLDKSYIMLKISLATLMWHVKCIRHVLGHLAWKTA